MDTITRRRFLTAGGVVAAGALAAGATAYGLRDILATAGRREPGRILVLVTLYGGNDGLNTVIPYADPAYAAARPGLSYDEGQVLALGDGFGLNPGLAGLHRLYGEDRQIIDAGFVMTDEIGPGPPHGSSANASCASTAAAAAPRAVPNAAAIPSPMFEKTAPP